MYKIKVVVVVVDVVFSLLHTKIGVVSIVSIHLIELCILLNDFAVDKVIENLSRKKYCIGINFTHSATRKLNFFFFISRKFNPTT